MTLVPDLSHPVWDQFEQDLKSATNAKSLLELRDKYLGRRRGLIKVELNKLGDLPPEKRPAAGQLLNQLRRRVQTRLEECLAAAQSRQQAQQLSHQTLDVTLPGLPHLSGHLHPIRRLQREMEEIFVSMGFKVVAGPEIESEYYNFEALNLPKGHPARDAQDTFYLTSDLVLRTHTSPVQVREMETQRPPIRIVAPGRVFRRDAVDATHSPIFHQMEVLVVDEGIHFGNLKGTLEVFFRALFDAETQIRLRPSFFPFVEPGAEVDISCIFCSGDGCRICKQSGWIEILGAGMVHPKVFEMVGYDPERFTGFAWGMGIDRLAILRYQVDDMRLFFENDLRFLGQF